jgi:hypothetical protein
MNTQHRSVLMRTRTGLVTAALFVAACSESVGPAGERGSPGAPLFSFSANGITLNKATGTLNTRGRLLIKGFNVGNPSHGDAIIATFYWLGSTNIIDSVRDVLTSTPPTRVGNQYHLVRYVQAGGYSMATYVATNVQNFPSPNVDPGEGDILAVAAYLSDSVADGGLTISAWTGVEDDFTAALGDHQASSGFGTEPMYARAGPIAIGAGAVAYTVTMSGLWGLDRPQDYTTLGPGSDNFIKQDAAYAVQGSAGTIDPAWAWFFGSPGDTWLVTTLALNPGRGTGDLTVNTSTSGLSLDLNGYAVTVDGAQSQAVGINGSVTFTGLTAGTHSVALSGVAVNCTVTGSNPRSVDVPAGATASTTFSVTCVPGPITGLTFTTQPSNAAPSVSITPAVKVKAVDAQGNTVTSYTGAVTMAIGRNAGLLVPGTLSGTKTVTPVSGVATFSTLSINQLGNGYTLRATTAGVPSVESASFNIALVCVGPLCL